MTIDELLEQLQQHRSRQQQRDYRPDWLRQFIARAADLFEPLDAVGRAGYDCQLDERGWTVSLYLGATEVIGGPLDGHIEHASFRINLDDLRRLFHSTEHFEWYSVSRPAADADERRLRSLLAVHGTVDSAENYVKLEILATPPDCVLPGLHCRPDGTLYES